MSSSSTPPTAQPQAITLHPRPFTAPSASNPLPQILQTPAGLALIELQGEINIPYDSNAEGESPQPAIPIGRIDFPEFRPDSVTASTSTAWMKRVYMHVGLHQRLTGEVKKLGKPLAVVRRRRNSGGGGREEELGGKGEEGGEELEVVEIVKYKIVFNIRPEPVSQE
ncbi:Ctf8-domain-containing protein [Cercophora scortea]|uniref:Ctf8-domain-containing protein n=1 Tax=Cercophora scortea TaxID=314031 RepID=A0AAE0I9B3_9PEZI|nr:Ctf8-domain-containing protein [Cercophora scortea]